MKKQEVNIVKAAVQRSAKLDQGMKVELGLTDAKEQQRLNKTFKPFAADPIVKKSCEGEELCTVGGPYRTAGWRAAVRTAG